ncbi:hypothetical protein I4U23_027312 [Adineta vaga]|nr:hypothetical protein I4U23_027312 [Adineta vaga]
MNVKNVLRWFIEIIHNYNLFIPDEDEYNDNEQEDPLTIVKHQRYTTRLYVSLFLVTFSILFTIALINPQTKTITVSNITPSLVNQLRFEHGETLSCPCSKPTIPYNIFVSNIISFHPICSSIFVKKEWIQTLYLSNTSAFVVMDFRTTASSQFELLAALCELSQKTVLQIQTDLNNTQLITIEFLPNNEVETLMNESIQLARTSLSSQFNLLLQFLQITIRLNSIVSALNTNAFITMVELDFGRAKIYHTMTSYYNKNVTNYLISLWTCDLVYSIVPVGFYSLSYNDSSINHAYWPEYLISQYNFQPNMSAKVDGFFGGCTPLDALLPSTLDCLYDNSCLELLTNYFPAFNQTNLNWINTLSSSKQQNSSINDSLTNLFVEEWLTTINYSNYFIECAPTQCTYTETNQTNFSHTITLLLLSLYGGLTIILRLIAVFLVHILSKFKHRTINPTLCTILLVTWFREIVQWLKQLNLFKSANNRTISDIKQQRITTRIYLSLFAISILIFLLFTSLNVETTTITVSNPSLIMYNHLEDFYSNTLKCPCSNKTILYSTFSSLSPIFHEICTSDFVSESWISMMVFMKMTDLYGPDARHFRFLLSLCQLSKNTIDDAIRRFKMRSMITSNLFTQFNFNNELNIIFKQFIQTLILDFSLFIDTLRLLIQVDQYLARPYFADSDPYKIIRDYSNNQESIQLSFTLTDQLGVNESMPFQCTCAIDPDCHFPIFFFNLRSLMICGNNYTGSYQMSGMVRGCYMIDSLLLSTLECFYSNCCLSVIYYYITKNYYYNNNISFTARPLVYDQITSRFPPNTSLQIIVKDMMIERWNSSFVFDRYFETCAPTYCTYSKITNRKNFIDIIITMISTISGLILILRLITPILVQFIVNLLKPKVKKQHQVRQKVSNRIKTILIKLSILLYNRLINLNIFPPRTFGSHIDRIKSKHFGQLATRLFIILFFISFILLFFYLIIQPRTLTKTFDQPTLILYKNLLINHNNTLQCPCSSISSMYDRFVNIEPIFHQICSSTFISNEWRKTITTVVRPYLSTYKLTIDYRLFLLSHLQFLNGLCDLSIKSVNDSINQFLSSLFVTAQLQSSETFSTHIQSLITQSKSNINATFIRLLSTIQMINHGNGIVSKYGTNFQYYFPSWYLDGYAKTSLALTKSIVYDNDCSCVFNVTCTTQAVFINKNSTEILPIKGLRMGCIPSETFLQSTLECFYDLTCVNLILKQINYTDSTYVPVLNLTHSSRFNINTTMNDLVSNLFIETWSTTIDYVSYFNQCSPIFCSYTYIQKINSLYTVTLFLGLSGGLSFVLKLICPKIIYILTKLYQCQQKRSNRVESIHNVEMSTVDS